VVVSHSYKEANQCVDVLVNIGYLDYNMVVKNLLLVNTMRLLALI